ncbi:MAG: methyltransferase family protein [Sphingomicrobium sp.]
MFAAHSISSLQLGTFGAISALLITALSAILIRNIDRPRSRSKRLRSIIGIALQAVGFAAAAIGFAKPALPWWAPYSLVSTVLVLLLGGTAVALFLSAAATMGKNWSIIARTRTDHQLVRTGPFAIVRHPIYLALLLYLISIAAALGHWQQLLLAMPFYLAGTTIRIRDEEALLRAQFGEEHARYVRDVRALIPLIV